MSKTTLAVVAAASAAAGASLSALLFSRPREQKPVPTPTAPQPPSSTTPRPAQPLPGSAPAAALEYPVQPDGILQYGFPGPISDTLLTPSHLSSFNRATRNPNFVAEHFTPHSLLMNNASRRHSVFYEDPAVPPMFRAKLADYARSG